MFTLGVVMRGLDPRIDHLREERWIAGFAAERRPGTDSWC
jgi:hypothetical protein